MFQPTRYKKLQISLPTALWLFEASMFYFERKKYNFPSNQEEKSLSALKKLILDLPPEALQEVDLEIKEGFCQKKNSRRDRFTLAQKIFLESLFQEGTIQLVLCFATF